MGWGVCVGLDLNKTKGPFGILLVSNKDQSCNFWIFVGTDSELSQ